MISDKEIRDLSVRLANYIDRELYNQAFGHNFETGGMLRRVDGGLLDIELDDEEYMDLLHEDLMDIGLIDIDLAGGMVCLRASEIKEALNYSDKLSRVIEAGLVTPLYLVNYYNSYADEPMVAWKISKTDITFKIPGYEEGDFNPYAEDAIEFFCKATTISPVYCEIFARPHNSTVTVRVDSALLMNQLNINQNAVDFINLGDNQGRSR